MNYSVQGMTFKMTEYSFSHAELPFQARDFVAAIGKDAQI